MNTKKLFFLTTMMVVFYGLQAQDMFLGGGFTVFTSNDTYSSYLDSDFDSRTSTFGISPYIGKQFNDQWSGGIMLDLSQTTAKGKDIVYIDFQSDTVDVKVAMTGIGVGIFGRYIIIPDKTFSIFIQPGAGYNTSSTKVYLDGTKQDVTTTTNILYAGIGLGAQYTLNDQWRAIIQVGGVNFNSTTLKIEGAETTMSFSSFVLGMELSDISFGIEYTF